MTRTTIDHRIINSPYEEPKYYWSYDRESRTFDKKDGGRPAGYVTRHGVETFATQPSPDRGTRRRGADAPLFPSPTGRGRGSMYEK